MDPQIFPWGGYCVGLGAIWARLLGYLTGTGAVASFFHNGVVAAACCR